MKKITAGDMPSVIGSRSRIGLGNACAEPQTLIEYLIENKDSFEALEIYGMIQYWTNRYFRENLWEKFKLKVFMVDRFTLEGMKKGFTEYIPCRYSNIPELFTKGYIRLDVALISVSPPNSQGNCSFGVSSDYTTAIARSAKTVIAEINQQMPWVYSNDYINVNEIDYCIETDRQLPQVKSEPFNEYDKKIGANVSLLIDDGATIQIGLGRLSEAVLASIAGKRRIGVHSGLMTDGIVELMEKGVIDNSNKVLKTGKTVTTTMIGTDKLYKFLHRNRKIEAFPCSYTHNLVTLAKVNRLHAINSAIQVDLSGQINAETVARNQVSGVGGQSDFINGASLSRDGKSIIILPSSSKGASISRIVPYLDKGAAVTSLRHDIDYVVTEQGIASLRGKTLKERAKALIEIAEPKFRVWLDSERVKVLP